MGTSSPAQRENIQLHNISLGVYKVELTYHGGGIPLAIGSLQQPCIHRCLHTILGSGYYAMGPRNRKVLGACATAGVHLPGTLFRLLA